MTSESLNGEPSDFTAALAATGAPWWLVREAVASTALDRDEGTRSEDAPTTCDLEGADNAQ